MAGAELIKVVDEIARLAQEGDSRTLLRMLDELIPGAAIRANPPPEITSIDQ